MSRSPKSCPICGKPRVEAFAPFCSPRCRDRDLLQWLDGGYALPGLPADPATHPDAGDELDGDS
jgi:endogenous inhibitor of DNA gyrase (YacG/DUF329 family)